MKVFLYIGYTDSEYDPENLDYKLIELDLSKDEDKTRLFMEYKAHLNRINLEHDHCEFRIFQGIELTLQEAYEVVPKYPVEKKEEQQ